MKALAIIFISCSLLLLSACSQILLLTGAGETQLNKLLDEQRYQQALLLIDNSTPQHAEHLQLLSRRDAVFQQQQQHVAKTIKQSQLLAQQKQWPQANKLLKNAIAKNSGNNTLQQALQQLQQQQQRFITQQRLALAEHNAKTLPRTQAITQQLLLAEPHNKKLLKQQYTIANQIDKAADQLELQVNASINQQQWQRARRYLNAYQQLKGPNSLADARATLDQQQQKLHHLQQRKTAKDSQLRLEQQQLALKLALENQDWPKVQKLLLTLEGVRKQQPAIAKLLDETTKKMQLLSHTLIHQGQRHYTHGRINEAINSWRQALDISPQDNDLKDRLQRAIRFQTNIEKLQ